MEVLTENLAGQELILLDNVQIKSEQKIPFPAGAKKIISVTRCLMKQKTVVEQNEVLLSGNLVTRLIFINEFDKYDSEDVSDTFEKKITVKDNNINQIYAHACLVKNDSKFSDTEINVSSIMSLVVQGVKTQDIRIVNDLTGDVEVQKKEESILNFNSHLNEVFEITENIQLDNFCEGVLGIDVNPILKDVIASSGKVNLKGVLKANVLCLKTVDGISVPYNVTHEIDFSKSLVVNGLTDDDLAIGNIYVENIQMHIENNQQGAVLVLSCEINFDGNTYVNRKFNMVTDAISFDKELTLQTCELTYTEILPQVNTIVDIENNINMAPDAPYISQVVSVDGMRVDSLQTNVADNKAILEGVLVINLLLESEDHILNGECFEVPFQSYVRVDNLDRDHFVRASVVPLMVNVKARRGKELLVDAQLGVTIQTESKKIISVVNSLIEGSTKVDDGSSIQIYIIGEKENLWNLAKRTNLSCEALLQQNPNLENGCVPGERIVVYRHEKVSL